MNPSSLTYRVLGARPVDAREKQQDGKVGGAWLLQCHLEMDGPARSLSPPAHYQRTVAKVDAYCQGRRNRGVSWMTTCRRRRQSSNNWRWDRFRSYSCAGPTTVRPVDPVPTVVAHNTTATHVLTIRVRLTILAHQPSHRTSEVVKRIVDVLSVTRLITTFRP